MAQKSNCETRNTATTRRKHSHILHDMSIGKDFITRTSFSQELKPTIVIRDFIKLKPKQNKTPAQLKKQTMDKKEAHRMGMFPAVKLMGGG